MSTDPYQVLGVSSDAQQAEVRAAYRTRAQILHPDRAAGLGAAAQGEAERLMVELNEAYALVSDPIRRAKHDRAANGASGSGDRAAVDVVVALVSHAMRVEAALPAAWQQEAELIVVEEILGHVSPFGPVDECLSSAIVKASVARLRTLEEPGTDLHQILFEHVLLRRCLLLINRDPSVLATSDEIVRAHSLACRHSSRVADAEAQRWQDFEAAPRAQSSPPPPPPPSPPVPPPSPSTPPHRPQKYSLRLSRLEWMFVLGVLALGALVTSFLAIQEAREESSAQPGRQRWEIPLADVSLNQGQCLSMNDAGTVPSSCQSQEANARVWRVKDTSVECLVQHEAVPRRDGRVACVANYQARQTNRSTTDNTAEVSAPDLDYWLEVDDCVAVATAQIREARCDDLEANARVSHVVLDEFDCPQGTDWLVDRYDGQTACVTETQTVG